MADKTKISWTGSTVNAIRARRLEEQADGAVKERLGWHCEHASEGCRNCYAEGMNRRFGTMLDYKPGHRSQVEIFLDEAMLFKPLGWKDGRPIFWSSMSDLFADFVPDEMIDAHMAVMALTPQHHHQVLTKRPDRMRQYLTRDWLFETIYNHMGRIGREHLINEPHPYRRIYPLGMPWPLPNVWVGFSAEDQPTFDSRWPEVKPLAWNGWLTWLSAEPLLGAMDISAALPNLVSARPHPDTGKAGLGWAVSGDESGSRRRPGNPDWHRGIRDLCACAGAPYFLKQMFVNGVKVENPELDGRQWLQFPERAT